jgi:hypothetical protein
MLNTRWLCVVAALLAPQVVPQTGASLQGRVVDTVRNQPIAHAQVVATKVGAAAVTDDRTIEADDNGRFAIRDLTAGAYRVFAQRDGFLRAEYGKTLAGVTGVEVTVNAGGAVDIVVGMIPAGAIAGRVTDRGKPARNVVVRALVSTYLDGQRAFHVRDWATTDDRGEYRLFGLAPGRFVVSAIPPQHARLDGDQIVVPTMPSNANSNRYELSAPATPETLDAAAFSRDVFVAAYYTGTADVALSTAVDVRAGETSSGVDIALTRTPVFHVRGHVTLSGITGATRAVDVGLSPVVSATNASIRQVQDTGGGFDIADVPPGRYFAAARMATSTGRSVSAATPIEVIGNDVEGVTIALQSAVTVSGVVTIDGRPPAPGGTPISVQLQNVGGVALAGNGAIRVQADGTFAVPDVSPRDYRVRVLPAGRGWIKGATFGSDDVLAGPLHVESDLHGRVLTIELSTSAATVDATVLDRNRQPSAGTLVVAVPDAARRGRSDQFHVATTDATGHAHLDGLAPGEYRLFASNEIDQAAWQDPDVVRKYESTGEILRLTEGGHATVSLRITP